jgi:hypothetical protein
VLHGAAAVRLFLDFATKVAVSLDLLARPQDRGGTTT